MKRIYWILSITSLLLLFPSLVSQYTVSAQRPFDLETFVAKRNDFMIREIGLTKTEADAFIPLYNELKQKMFEVGRDCRKVGKDLHKKKNPTDADYMQVAECNMEVKQKEVSLEQAYFTRFKSILSPEKLYKYQQAEHKFAREFMGGAQRNNAKKSNR
ncbi:hypothetical protein [Parabacteroides sp. Marseille-P3160]|uniref:hypothetical protein n=1 Tax=Parabacteroides sp. Marseille-P3160 TaxID=1917887 RepID=UPI0009BC508A|nr:hypothetical protein [Parabacteroides sp. Marseille-P3160]